MARRTFSSASHLPVFAKPTTPRSSWKNPWRAIPECSRCKKNSSDRKVPTLSASSALKRRPFANSAATTKLKNSKSACSRFNPRRPTPTEPEKKTYSYFLWLNHCLISSSTEKDSFGASANRGGERVEFVLEYWTNPDNIRFTFVPE